MASLTLLASCGGGTLENAFSPSRIVSFGDEASAMTTATSSTTGPKYSVNYLDTTSAATPFVNCGLYPVWTQYLANAYNLPFPQCVGTGVVAPSVMRAAIGARIADVSAQVDAYLASNGPTNRDLATLMIGANDILDEYAAYAAGSQTLAAGQAELTARASTVVVQIQRILNAGGKVLIATVPNQGLTPWGLGVAQRSADLGTLSTSFNNALRTALVNYSGRDVGLILADEIVRLDSAYPGSYNLANVTDALCAAPQTADLLNCTLASLASPGTDPATWLWAGFYMLGPTANAQIGSQAYSRATNNPF